MRRACSLLIRLRLPPGHRPGGVPFRPPCALRAACRCNSSSLQNVPSSSNRSQPTIRSRSACVEGRESGQHDQSRLRCRIRDHVADAVAARLCAARAEIARRMTDRQKTPHTRGRSQSPSRDRKRRTRRRRFVPTGARIFLEQGGQRQPGLERLTNAGRRMNGEGRALAQGHQAEHVVEVGTRRAAPRRSASTERPRAA